MSHQRRCRQMESSSEEQHLSLFSGLQFTSLFGLTVSYRRHFCGHQFTLQLNMQGKNSIPLTKLEESSNDRVKTAKERVTMNVTDSSELLKKDLDKVDK